MINRKEYLKNRQTINRTNGKCIIHPSMDVIPGKIKCIKCQAYKDRLKNQGRCHKHPARDAVCGKTLCASCSWSLVLKRARITDEQATKILENQKYKCALSGIKLIKGINASPDHIIPKSQSGTYDISNVRFVDKNINYARRDLLDEDFIQMCKNVIEYQQKR